MLPPLQLEDINVNYVPIIHVQDYVKSAWGKQFFINLAIAKGQTDAFGHLKTIAPEEFDLSAGALRRRDADEPKE